MFLMSTEYIEKFSYRKYTGKFESRWKRVWSLAKFEIVSTWNKSTLGKVLLIILIFSNVLIAFITFQISGFLLESGTGDRQSIVFNTISGLIGGYFTFGPGVIQSEPPSPDGFSFNFSVQIGIMIIALIGIAGSGYFADDKQGRVVEVYLSRITREEYAIGKLTGMFLYSNIFTTIPLLFTTFLYLQGFGEDHFQYLDLYAGVAIFGFITAILLGSIVLILSTLLEKRAYASLSFFLMYLLGSIFGARVFFSNDSANEFLLLLSPSNFLGLLGYALIGDHELGLGSSSTLLLNDNLGLESFHIIGLALALSLLFLSFLVYKIHKITTDEI